MSKELERLSQLVRENDDRDFVYLEIQKAFAKDEITAGQRNQLEKSLGFEEPEEEPTEDEIPF